MNVLQLLYESPLRVRSYACCHIAGSKVCKLPPVACVREVYFSPRRCFLLKSDFSRTAARSIHAP